MNVKTNFEGMRTQIFKSFLMTVKEFTARSVKTVRSEQFKAITGEEQKEGKQEGPQILVKNKSFAESNYFLYLALDDGCGTLYPIYKDPTLVPAIIRKFIYTQESLRDS